MSRNREQQPHHHYRLTRRQLLQLTPPLSLAVVAALSGCSRPKPLRIAPPSAVDNSNALRGAAIPIPTSSTGAGASTASSEQPTAQPAAPEVWPPANRNLLGEYLSHPQNTHLDSVGNGEIGFYHRQWDGINFHYSVIYPQQQGVHFDILTAQNAQIRQDWSDSYWVDGAGHEASHEEMAQGNEVKVFGNEEGHLKVIGPPPYGGPRFEGTIVKDGIILHLNDRRASLALAEDGRAHLGVFSEAFLIENRIHTAISGGPMCILPAADGSPRIASTATIAPDDPQYMGFNPKGEDFHNIDERIKFYNEVHPQTMVGMGHDNSGRQFIVLGYSTGTSGFQLAHEYAQMGVNHAFIMDGDTFGRLSWLGHSGPAHYLSFNRENGGAGAHKVSSGLGVYWSGQ